MYTAKNAYVNEGCVSGNKYKIVKTDDFGKVVVIYDGYYDYKRYQFKLYPAKLDYPRYGKDRTDVHTISDTDVIPKSRAE